MRIEDLFRGEGLEELLTFVGLPALMEPVPFVDRFHFLANECDPRRIAQHAEVVELARVLGYDPLAFDEPSLRRRYLRPSS
jgi:hypothetical protein